MPKANAAGISNRKTKTARQLLRTDGREKSFFRKCLAENVDQDTSCNSGADNACHVGAHCVHQQEVGGILALTNLLRNTEIGRAHV